MESSSSPQQVPTNSTSTGNPQEISGTGLQNPGQSSGLQDAGTLTPDALNALDGGGAAIQLAATSQTTAQTTESPSSVPSVLTKNNMLYGGIALLVVLFLAVLIYGLFYKKH